MNYDSLAALLEHPPVRTTLVTLPNDVTCQIHELPISAIDRVRTISEDDDQVDMSDVVYVATWALAGREPTDKELVTVSDRFGTSSVMAIYTEALRFSQLGADAIEQEKKH
ncbi:hypothetical protein [Endozoicomonas sp. SCSIO W0465]|uniref:hypothetical protein n=1 Tax=Endozoicomonas sp. SCSIO W0465 TaxID=2918516 RepID=UPI0020761DBD|nr:hypothetical protein [Endozoicomonas sp. SCSIO W0465]USE39242.1 hypothetical protein MJO57_14415 [Endozoicomonas sp. SCSIO W0465]